MNYSDTERICSVLDSYWLSEVSSDKEADLVIFNTCSIKQKAEDKVFWIFHNLKKYKKKFPHRKFWVTWCMVKKTWIRDKESLFYSNDPLLRRSDLLDFVFRIHDLPKLPKILQLDQGTETYKNISGWDAINLVSTVDSLTSSERQTEEISFFQIKQKLKTSFQAIVPIQTWCDNFCTYCVVPYTRWRENSRSIEDIVREIKIYVKRWAKEIILVGQNVNSYWKGSKISKRKWNEENSCWFEWEEKTPFAILLEKVNEIEWVERIRFQSSNPHDMTDDIIQAIKTLPKVMPSLHFALQSWNDEVLKSMNRRHTYKEFKTICEKLREWNKNFAITTDIIVWFCWETEKQFQDTLKAIDEIWFDMIYISQYSERKWTYSSDKMKDDVSREEKAERWHICNEVLKKSVEKRLWRWIWKKAKVLIEKYEDWFSEWKTEENYTCRIKWEFDIWEIVEVEVVWKSQWALEWKV